jgi:hypothetical protein
MSKNVIFVLTLLVESEVLSVIMKSTTFWDVMLCSSVEVQQYSSETSLNFYQSVRCYIPENSTLLYTMFIS